MNLPPSPFQDRSLADYARRLRSGEIRARSATRALLARIEANDAKLRAYTFVDAGRALARAEALDRLLAADIDLGPLMGVPIAVKDLFSVDGMPTTAGSEVDIADLVAPQGRFIDRLQRAGCVILGKTATTEFALGGFNLKRPPPSRGSSHPSCARPRDRTGSTAVAASG